MNASYSVGISLDILNTLSLNVLAIMGNSSNTQADDGNEGSTQSHYRTRSILTKKNRGTRSLPVHQDTEPPPAIISPASSNFTFRDDAELLDLVLDEVDYFYQSEKLAAQQLIKAQSNFVEPTQLDCFSSSFQVIKELGSGASCRVIQVRGVMDGEVYAVKEMSIREAVNLQLWTQECKILQTLSHPNIVDFVDAYIDRNSYFIATEFCSGGTLLDKVIRLKSLSEIAASRYIADILSAIDHMHRKKIVHRDLKAANIVFSHPGIGGVLKIIDFGESLMIDDDDTNSECVGTIHYMPPEVVRARTGRELRKSDMWSIGIIAFILVVGRPPFTGKTPRQIFRSIKTVSNKYIFPRYVPLSRSFKSFVRNLLTHDIEERMSAQKALEHRWISKRRASMLRQRELPLRPVLTDSRSLSLSTTSVLSTTTSSRPRLRPSHSTNSNSITICSPKHVSIHHGSSSSAVLVSPSPETPDLSHCASETYLNLPMMEPFPEEPTSPLAMAMEWDTSYLDEVAVEKAWALLESDENEDADNDIHVVD